MFDLRLGKAERNVTILLYPADEPARKTYDLVESADAETKKSDPKAT